MKEDGRNFLLQTYQKNVAKYKDGSLIKGQDYI